MSTDDQAERGLSIPAQVETCTAAARRHEWPVRAVFTDEGVSAGKPLDKRPGLIAAIAALEPGDILLIAKRDRIFRADPFECAVIERSVKGREARIASVAGEGTDDDSPSSILMRRLLDAFAEYERLLIAARTRAVLDSKRRKSQRLGQVPYGFKLDADGKTLHLDPDEAALIVRIHGLRADGLSLRGIAERLNAEHIPTKRGANWTGGGVGLLVKRHPCPPSPQS